MGRIDLNAQTKDRFLERIRSIRTDSARRWGTMSPTAMLAHLRRAKEIALEEIEVKDESTFFIRNIMAPVALSGLLPWPKGKLKTMPVFLPEDEQDLDRERQKLIACVERFVERSEAEPDRLVVHPAMGPTRLRRFQRMCGMHTDHHLRQFSV